MANIDKIRYNGIDYDIGGIGDSLPMGSVIEYDGDLAPEGYEEVEDKGIIYTTDETRIGTWVDGKPLYRKVMQVNGINGTGDRKIGTINTSSSIKKFTGTFYNTSNKGYYTLTGDAVQIYCLNGEVKIKFVGDWGIGNVLVTSEYTKTTD